MKNTPATPTKHRAQIGAAAVEFALIFSIFLVLVFAIVEFGAILFNKAVITNASREAARAGVVLRTPKLATDEVESIARRYCGQAAGTDPGTWGTPSNLIGFSSANVFDVTATGAAGSFGTPLAVTVTYDYHWLVLGPFAGFGVGPLQLSATTEMKNE